MPNPGFVLEDVWDRINIGAPDECWEWLGAANSEGYGRFRAQRRSMRAHRVAYELTHGSVPEGLVLDHLCRNRRCCNPSHLEPVTDLENFWRSPLYHGNKTHCPQGHPYVGTNVIRRRGRRYCRECTRAYDRRRGHRPTKAELARKAKTAVNSNTPSNPNTL